MSKRFQYVTKGTCSRLIEIETEGDHVTEVRFSGGCHGNTQGLSALVKGMRIDDVISRLDGIMCGDKQTSCPDQLAQALRQMESV